MEAVKKISSKQLCVEHEEKLAFICVQKNCSRSFKLSCLKCRKDHAQHPNRLIMLADFHKMYDQFDIDRISKPIKYLENSVGYNLLNLKKKVDYIRDFRTWILEKQMQLIQSNNQIKENLKLILQEHYSISDIVVRLDQCTLETNRAEYQANLEKVKDYISFNPVKNELMFINETIKTSKYCLEKNINVSHCLTDNIREYLIKIIEVLMANCTHEEEDEEIQYQEHEDVSATTFNISIKNRTLAMENPNIKSKIEHADILEIFDEGKEALTKQVETLQKEIQMKSLILQTIKSIDNSSAKSGSSKQLSSKAEDVKNEESRVANEQVDNAEQGIAQLTHNQFLENLKNQFQSALSTKDHQILEYQRSIQEKIHQIQLLNQARNSQQTQSTKLKSENVQQFECSSTSITKETNQCIEQKLILSHNQITHLTNLLAKQQASNQQFTFNSQRFTTLIQLLEKQLSESTKIEEFLRSQQTIYCATINQLTSQIQLTKSQTSQQLHRNTLLSRQIQAVNHNLITLQVAFKDQKQKVKEFQEKMQAQDLLASEIKAKNKELRDAKILDDNKIQQSFSLIMKLQNKIKNDQEMWRIKQKNFLSKIHDLQKVKSKAQQKRDFEPEMIETKKWKEIKQMLQISIKKNQELKDKNYELQLAISDMQADKHFKDMQADKHFNDMQADKHYNEKIRSSKIQPNRSQNQEIDLAENKSQSRLSFNEKPRKVALQEQPIANNKNIKKQTYLEIQSIFKNVTEDMKILEERLKESSVVEKVYLKELDRKKNQNKTLKKELENMKVYGTNRMNPDDQNLGRKNSNLPQEKQDIKFEVTANSQISHGNASSKVEQNPQRKYNKVITK